MIKGTIDRFEEDYVIIEIEGEMKIIDKGSIPSDAREGDVLIYSKNVWSKDEAATARLKKEANERMDRLWKD